jgi:long-chain acyl-CoA synthetase
MQYPNIPLHEVMRATARRYPSRTAIWCNARSISFYEFDAESNRLANALHEHGVRHGDRVGLFMPNCPEYEVSFYAVSKLGACACPLSPSYRSFEVTYQLRDAGASVLITHARLWNIVEGLRAEIPTVRLFIVAGEKVGTNPPSVQAFDDLLKENVPDPPAEEVRLDDLAVLPYSSGTTGMPKGVMLTHRNLVCNHTQWGMAGGMTTADMYMVYLPLSHIYGVGLMGLSMWAGATQLILERFDASIVTRILQEKPVTILFVVPPILQALLDTSGLTSSHFRNVRYAMSAAAPLAPELANRFHERFGVHVIQGYGMTEASPDTHHSPLDPARIKRESCGIPVSDTEQKIVDLEKGERTLGCGEIGEIVVCGPQVMRGYWNAPEETARTLRDGWLYTGDIGYIDNDGYLFVVDRKKEMIKFKAFSIAPAELEAVVWQHPDVADCAVIGVPDPEAGEIPKAYVVPQSGRDIQIGSLAEWVNSRLAAYKAIGCWEIVAKIPRTPSGKILRRELKRSILGN